MLYAIVLGVHVIVCILLIMVVLLQSAKGGGLAGGSAFGGGAEATMFGARGAATMLSKATTIFGGMFMVTSLTLTLLGATRTVAPRSIITEEAQRAPAAQPTQPPGAPTGGVPGAAPGGSAPLPETGPEQPTPQPAQEQAPAGGDDAVPEAGAPGGE